MKKLFICICLSFCLMFMGKIKTNALSVEDYANYTYDKEFIMNAYQSFMNEVGSVVTGDIFIYRNNGVDYITGFYSSNYDFSNVCRGIDNCVPETASPQLTIFSYSNNSSQTTYDVDALTMSIKVGSERIVKVDMQSNGKVGYRLNKDGMIIKEYPYHPSAGWPSFVFDNNFKFYTNAKIRFLRDSRFGKEFHGLLAGTKDNFQFDFPNKPLSNGTWSKGDEPLYAIPDTSEIEIEDKLEGVEACEYAQGDVFAVVKYIGCWLKNIWVSIKNFFVDLFKTLFVPTKFQELVDQTAEKFSGFKEIANLKDKINIDVDQQTTFIKFGNQELIDRSIFDPFMPFVHTVVVAFSYFGFVVYLIREIPKVLEGIG